MTNHKNVPAIINKIEKNLRTRRPPEDKVFPLSPTHRKELRELRNKNLADIKTRLKTIRELKRKEFMDKYDNKIQQELKKHEEGIATLNKNWQEINNTINKLIAKQRKLEEEIGMENITVDRDYEIISRLETKQHIREYKIDGEAVNKILNELFNKKFAEKFEAAQEQIDKMMEQYEEAINFGDLEIVKELYYNLKDADNFLDKVANIQV